MTASSPYARLQPHIFLIITAFAWGGNAVAGKLAVGHISPMVLTLFRWTLAMVVIWAIAWPHVRKDWPQIRPRLPYLFVMGMVGYSGFNILLYTALKYTSTINVVIEQSAMPLVIFIGNLLFFRIAATARQISGFLLTLIGVMLVVSRGNPLALLEQGLNFGDALMVIAVIAYSGYSIALRARPDISWQSLFAMLVTAAFLTALPAAIWEHSTGAAIWPTTLQGWLIGLYAAIFPSLVSQILYIRAVDQLGANVAGLYINLVPIFGTFLAVVIVGEAFGWYQALALVLVLGGILFAQTGSKAPITPKSGNR